MMQTTTPSPEENVPQHSPTRPSSAGWIVGCLIAGVALFLLLLCGGGVALFLGTQRAMQVATEQRLLVERDRAERARAEAELLAREMRSLRILDRKLVPNNDPGSEGQWAIEVTVENGTDGAVVEAGLAWTLHAGQGPPLAEGSVSHAATVELPAGQRVTWKVPIPVGEDRWASIEDPSSAVLDVQVTNFNTIQRAAPPDAAADAAGSSDST